MSIALSLGNNLTTGGVFTSSAVNNTSVTNVTDFASVPGGGVLKLLSTQTASSDASISFTTGIDSTYETYLFKFINVHPSSDGAAFQFQGSTNGGSSYGVTITSSNMRMYNKEDGTDTNWGASTNFDLAQSTSYQSIIDNVGSDNDQGGSGELFIYNPSSTTFTKHFIATGCSGHATEYCYTNRVGGYFNTTSAVNAISFQFDAGNIDSGIIKLYGVT